CCVGGEGPGCPAASSAGQPATQLVRVTGEVASDVGQRELAQDRRAGLALEQERERLANGGAGLGAGQSQAIEVVRRCCHLVLGGRAAVAHPHTEPPRSDGSDLDLRHRRRSTLRRRWNHVLASPSTPICTSCAWPPATSSG